MKKHVLKLVMICCLFSIAEVIFALEIEVNNNNLYVSDGIGKRQITFDGITKTAVAISPDNKKIAFFEMMGAPVYGQVQVVDVAKPGNVLKLNHVEFWITSIKWRNPNTLFLMGPAARGNDCLYYCEIGREIKISYYVFGRDFTFSPDLKRVVFNNMVAGSTPEKFYNDYVLLLDVEKNVHRKGFLQSEKDYYNEFLFNLYPYNGKLGKDSFDDLDERHIIASDLKWIDANKVVFTDYNRKMIKAVSITFKKNAGNKKSIKDCEIKQKRLKTFNEPVQIFIEVKEGNLNFKNDNSVTEIVPLDEL